MTVPEDPFEQRSADYDLWYDRHEAAYRSEFRAVQEVLAPVGRALEVGVGTGRFAAPLGIRFGADPAAAMLRRARERGVTVIWAVDERLPFRDRCFDRVLRSAAFRPVRRVQTLSRLPDELEEPEEPRTGTGDGLFAVVEAAPR